MIEQIKQPNIQYFDFSVNLLQSLLWQYNDADRLQTLLTKKQEWYSENQQKFWEDWYRNVFDLRTANEFGLSVWAIILNLPLQIGVPYNPNKPTFGFGPEGMGTNNNKNFENGNFSAADSFSLLTLEEKRFFLRLRYFQLTSRCSTIEINKFLNFLLQDFDFNWSAYVLDNLDMTIEVVFTENPGRRFLFILKIFDLIPRATGVAITYTILP